MDTRERILAALRWQEPDRVPLTIYDVMFPRGDKERLLRAEGVGLVAALPVQRSRYRQVEVVDREYWQAGRKLVRRTMRTPVGEIWQTLDPESPYEHGLPWIVEHFIKGPDDYRVMEYVVEDAVYTDNYEAIREADRRLGGDGVVILALFRMPIQQMVYLMLGMEQFSLDYHFRRDLIDSLNEKMLARYNELFELAAAAPVEVIRFGDNITCDVVGRERFARYCPPVYSDLKRRLAGSDKLVAVHMDGRLAGLAGAIAEAEIDVVEAFTPPPVGDVSVSEARRAWPEKALWLNFTSSYVAETDGAIEQHARQLLAEAGGRRGFVLGVTENAPPADLERCLGAISRVLRE